MAARHARRRALHCCPACAASARRRRARRGRTPWAWVALLGLVAALIPVAAMDGPGDGRAAAQPVAEAAAAAEGALTAASAAAAAERPPPAARPAAARRARPAQAAPRRPRVEWQRSRAVGTPNAGRLEDGVRLPPEGPGYYTYNPATQRPPGGADRTWGTDALVRQVLALGAWWARAHPGAPRLGVGDLSRPEGGPFTGPGVGHVSHQNGLDVDIRLIRADGGEGRAGPQDYDRELTQAVVDRLVRQGARMVLIGPSLDLRGPPGVVMRWPNHDDHLHVRFPAPRR